MELRHPESVGVLDDHESGIGHIDADFNNGSADEKVEVMQTEGFHDPIFFRLVHAPMQQTEPEFMEGAGLQRRVGLCRGLCILVFLLGYQRTNDVSLASLSEFLGELCIYAVT